jgi:hypothetical protein
MWADIKAVMLAASDVFTVYFNRFAFVDFLPDVLIQGTLLFAAIGLNIIPDIPPP